MNDNIMYWELEGTELEVETANRYYHMYNNSKKRGIEFNLSITDVRRLLKRRTCHYSGAVLVKGLHPSKIEERGGQLGNAHTIDRVNPNHGYIKGNVVACSHESNALKNTIEKTTFRELRAIKRIYEALESSGFTGKIK